MDKFELALLQINSAKKLATCYKMMLKQHIYVVASEEVAIRSVIHHEIDTWDPYDEEVRVWRA